MKRTLGNNWIFRSAVLVVAALLFMLAGSPVGTAKAQTEPERVAMGSDMVIAQGDVVQGDVSVTNGNLVLKGEVRGNVAVVNGNADIEGKVSGDVAVTSGKIALGSGSSVGGNVVALVGDVTRAPGAVVGGAVSNIRNPLAGAWGSVVPGRDLGGPPAWLANSLGRFAGVAGWGMLSLVLMVLSALMVAITPGRSRISADTLQTEVGPSVIVGVITALLLPVGAALVSLALVVTIVGAVLVPVVMFVVGLALLFGLTVISIWMGRHMYSTVQPNSGINSETGAPLVVQVLLGVPVILASTVVPAALLPGWVGLLMLPLLYFASCVGLGGVILSRLGTLAPNVRKSAIVTSLTKQPAPYPPEAEGEQRTVRL